MLRLHNACTYAHDYNELTTGILTIHRHVSDSNLTASSSRNVDDRLSFHE